VANVNLAVSRSWKPQDSEEYKTKTSFLSCAVWGDAAQRVTSLAKGDIAILEFSMADLEAQAYTSADGEARTNLKVLRSNIQLFAHAGSAEAGEFPEEQGAPAEAQPDLADIPF